MRVLKSHSAPKDDAVYNYILKKESEGIEYLTSRIPRSEIYKQTGDPVGTTFSNAKLAWLKLHEPENWEKTALFSTMQDYFLK